MASEEERDGERVPETRKGGEDVGVNGGGRPGINESKMVMGKGRGRVNENLGRKKEAGWLEEKCAGR